MKFKHYIVVRVLCVRMTMTDEQLTSDKVINNHLLLVENNLIPSLLNQTRQDFELVFLVHNELPAGHWEFKKLVELGSGIPTTVVKYGKFTQFVNKARQENETIAITRIDDDDFAARHCVQIVYDLLNNDSPTLIHGYNFGYLYRDDTCELYTCAPPYKQGGHHLAFQTVIQHRTAPVTLHPYMWSHHDVVPMLG